MDGVSEGREGRRFRANRQIVARSVRLIDDHGTEIAVMSIARALALAERHGDDLIEVGPDRRPPACRLMQKSLDDR